MPSVDNPHDGKEEEENEADENEKDSIEQSSSSEEEEESSDEYESDSRRAECADDIFHLEKQFLEMKEQLYGERIQLVDTQLEEVQTETSVLYTQQLKDLDATKQRRIEIADTLHSFQHDGLGNRCDCELQASRQHLENERRSLLDTMRSEIEERLQRAEEDCTHLELSNDVWNEQRPQKRQRRGEGMPEKKRKTTVTGPVIIYMLPEMDIIEDWATIRRATMKVRKKSSATSSLSRTSSSPQPSNSHANAPPASGSSAIGKSLPVASSSGPVGGVSASIASPLGNGHYEDGKLYFQDDWYLRGSKIVVKDLAQDHTVPATIASISPSEVSLSYTDGAKSKFSLSQLQRGKISISFQE